MQVTFNIKESRDYKYLDRKYLPTRFKIPKKNSLISYKGKVYCRRFILISL